jgi:isopenicillin N synthase-like dioxygenase
VSGLPLIDLGAWTEDRDPAVARALDEALVEFGFLLVTGHGVPDAVLDEARRTALAFFHLPPEAKARCIGGGPAYRGWFGPGTQSNAATFGVETPPDHKETFAVGMGEPPPGESAATDPVWWGANVFPAEVPAMEAAWLTFRDECTALAGRIIGVCEAALGLPVGWMLERCTPPPVSAVANWYPALRDVPAAPGAFRIGPHTDFGTLTIVDRQPGRASLQIQLADDSWVDAPVVPGALTVNVGDLLSHWTGGRWRSTRHRVPGPDPAAPDEELLSLVLFHDPALGTLIEPLDGSGPAVRCRDWLGAKIAALAVDGTYGS